MSFTLYLECNDIQNEIDDRGKKKKNGSDCICPLAPT